MIDAVGLNVVADRRLRRRLSSSSAKIRQPSIGDARG
jgi:hypothetical protein